MRSAAAMTSSSLWEMKISDSPCRAISCKRRKQPFRLDIGQHRGRLVEDQDAGVVIERLEDFDPLLFADREIAEPGIGIDVEAEASRRSTAVCARPAAFSELPGPELFRSRS